MSQRQVYNPINEIIKQTLEAKRVEIEQERNKQETERLKQEKELEKERLAQQHEIQTKQLDLATAVHELDKSKQAQLIDQVYRTTGAKPPGSTETRGVTGVTGDPESGFSNINIGPKGMGDNDVELNVPNVGIFKTQTPEASSARTGSLGLKSSLPMLEKQQQLQDAVTARAVEVENLKTKAAAEVEKQKQKFELDKQEKDLLNKIEVENIRGSNRIKAAQVSVDKVTPTQKDKFADFKDLQQSVQEVKDIFDSTPDGYASYYIGGGPVGSIKESLTSIYAPSTRYGIKGIYSQEDVRQKLAAIELKAKNLVGKLGGALTPNEQQMLEQLSPSPGVNFTADRGKSRINGFLQGLENSIAGMAKPGTTNNSIDMIDVKTDPDAKPGKIHKTQWDQFKIDHPKAVNLSTKGGS